VSEALIDLAPLRSSLQFRRLWIGCSFSSVGSLKTLVAAMFQVWQLTRSPIWTGGVGLAQALPLIGIGLFAGSIVDRHDRRRQPHQRRPRFVSSSSSSRLKPRRPSRSRRQRRLRADTPIGFLFDFAGAEAA